MASTRDRFRAFCEVNGLGLPADLHVEHLGPAETVYARLLSNLKEVDFYELYPYTKRKHGHYYLPWHLFYLGSRYCRVTFALCRKPKKRDAKRRFAQYDMCEGHSTTLKFMREFVEPKDDDSEPPRPDESVDSSDNGTSSDEENKDDAIIQGDKFDENCLFRLYADGHLSDAEHDDGLRILRAADPQGTKLISDLRAAMAPELARLERLAKGQSPRPSDKHTQRPIDETALEAILTQLARLRQG